MKQEILKSLIEWNPWIEEEFPQNLLGIKRDIDVVKYLEFREIKILEGSRRVGKSTLLYQVIYEVLKTNKNVLYINFDDEILRNYSLSQIYEVFLEKGEVEYLFIDEIQNCVEWSYFVRKLYDMKTVKQIWITGSNSSIIKKEYSSLLTGRNITLDIFSLSFKEFLRFKGVEYDNSLVSMKKKADIKKLFGEYVKYGSFPEIALRTSNRKELLINYFEDFLYKDIVSRYGVNGAKLKELALFLASNSSKIISYRNLSKTLHLNFQSVVDYICYFEEVYLFSLMNRYDYSIKKQLSSSKKVYSMDIGLANAISFKFSEDKGRLLENLVFIELKRRGSDIYYHKYNYECDFIIKEELDIVEAIQVTDNMYEEETKKREINGLVDALKTYNLESGVILTEEEEEELEYQGFKISIIPLWKWLLG